MNPGNDAMNAAIRDARGLTDPTSEELNRALRGGRVVDLPAEDTEPEAKRRAVGAVVGLPEAVADRLRGDTVDDLLADARSLAGAVEGSPGPPPIPSFDAGTRPPTPPGPPDMNVLLRAHTNRRRRVQAEDWPTTSRSTP